MKTEKNPAVFGFWFLLKVFFSVVESSSGHLSDDMVQAIRSYVFSLKTDPPRTLNLSILPCAYIYTDASLEPSAEGNIGGIGGVLVGPAGLLVALFSAFPLKEDLRAVVVDLDAKSASFCLNSLQHVWPLRSGHRAWQV